MATDSLSDEVRDRDTTDPNLKVSDSTVQSLGAGTIEIADAASQDDATILLEESAPPLATDGVGEPPTDLPKTLEGAAYEEEPSQTSEPVHDAVLPLPDEISWGRPGEGDGII